MAVNVEELEENMKWVEEHPEQHQQGVWLRRLVGLEGEVCGTAYCFAGAYVHRKGYKAIYGSSLVHGEVAHHVEILGIGQVDIGDFVEKKLGLTRAQADILFDATNTLADLREIVDLIKDGDVEDYIQFAYRDDVEDDDDEENHNYYHYSGVPVGALAS